MRTRWRTLFGCALVSLIGIVWLTQRYGWSWSRPIGVDLVGLIGTCGIGFIGAVTQTRKRWPAAVALVCAAPMGTAILSVGTSLPRLILYLGVPGLFMIGGAAATCSVALYVLLATPPRPPVDRIPPARLT